MGTIIGIGSKIKRGGGGSPSPTLQEKTVLITENGDISKTPDTGYGGLSKVNLNVNVPQGGGVPVVDPPSGDFYAAIAYFTAENGDFDNIAYAFANNSSEFNAQFCHLSVFANFTLHSTAGGSDSVIIPQGKICGFYFGSQFDLTALPSHFLRHCYSFNQPLTLPSGLTSIGTYFMAYCYSLNQPITLPSSLTSIGNYLLYNSYNFDRLITNCAVSPANNILSMDSTDAAAYVNGITVSGTYAQTWINNLPNRVSSPYRKLILAP